MTDQEDFSYSDAFGIEEQIQSSTPVATPKSTRNSVSKAESTGSCFFFWNRLAFCLFAQVLLWTTTLRNSTIIASDYISVITFSSVYSSCAEGHRVIAEEKSNYDYCVKKQLNMCDLDFDDKAKTETRRVQQGVEANFAIQSSISNQQQNCSTVLKSSKQILSSWNSRKTGDTILFTDSCEKSSQLLIQADIGKDHTSSYKASSFSASYVESSNSRISTLSTYASDLTAYNYDYIQNKTENLHLQTLEAISIKVNEHIKQLEINFRPIYNLTDDILACMSLDSSAKYRCTFPDNLYDEFRYAQLKLQNQLNILTLNFERYKLYVNNYVSNVQIAILNANRFYQSVMGSKGLIRWLIDTVKILYSIGDMCGNTSPNFCTFDPSNWAVATPEWPIFSMTVDLPDTSAIMQKMNDYVASINPRIDTVSSTLKSQLRSLEGSLDAALDSVEWVPKDYNPPRYPSSNSSAKMEAKEQAAESKNYLTSLQQILYNSSADSSSNAGTIWDSTSSIKVPTLSVNTTWIQAKSRTIWSTVQNKTRSWSITQFDYFWILESFLTLQGILFLFDYLYRGVQSVRLLTRFWSRSIIKLPTIKAIEDEENAMFGTVSSTVQCCQLFFRLVPLFWVQSLILLAMVVATIFIVSALIVPEYHSYCRACVHHSANETFVSELGYTAAYNFAAASGNSRWASGIASYNSHSYATCDRGIATSQQGYLQTMETIQALNQSYAVNVLHSQLLHQCLDFQNLDTTIAAACCLDEACNIRNTSSTTAANCPAYLQTERSHPILLRQLWEETEEIRSNTSGTAHHKYCNHKYLVHNDHQQRSQEGGTTWVNGFGHRTQSAVFDCSSLPSCRLTCKGPNELLIQHAAKDCSCRLEWFWNGHLLQGVLVVVIFLLLNISRDLVCSGLLRVWWAYFLPPVIPVLIGMPVSGRKRHLERRNRSKWRTKLGKIHQPKAISKQNRTDGSNIGGHVSGDIEYNADLTSSSSTSSSSWDEELNQSNTRRNREYINAATSEKDLRYTSHGQDGRTEEDEKERFILHDKIHQATKKLQDKIRWKIMWFTGMGYMKIAIGLAINYLWYSFAVAIQRNIAYDGHPYGANYL